MSEVNQKNPIVKKHTSAIHMSGVLTLTQRKLFNILLWHAYDELLTTKEHKIPISTLVHFTDTTSHNLEFLKNSLRKLRKADVEFDVLDEDGDPEWKNTGYLSTVGLKHGSGYCTYEFSDFLAKKLTDPELYGIVSLDVQKYFKSGHALTIYEICCRYKGLLKTRPMCYTSWMPLEKFKVLLGVENTEYCKEYKHLNSKILKPSITEINGGTKKYVGTDIEIELEVKKSGRSVSDIRFKIRKNAKSTLPLEADQNEAIMESELFKRIRALGLAEKAAIAYIKSHTEEYITEKVELTEEAQKTGKIKSLGGYLTSAISKDYKPVISETEEFKKEREAKEAQAAKLANDRRKEEAKRGLSDMFSAEIREEYIFSLSHAAKESLLSELKAGLPPDMRKFVKTLSSPMIATQINAKIDNFDVRLQDMLTKADEELVETV